MPIIPSRTIGTLCLVALLIGLFEWGLPATQAATYYVTTNGTGNGSSWASPTNSIQGAISLCVSGDVVLVSNGVYQTGGVTNSVRTAGGRLLTNRVVIATAYVTVMSANNDPTNTVIQGAYDPTSGSNGPAAVRCVYMAGNTTLIGFTLTNGATLAAGDDEAGYGGGVCASSSAVISNCVITGNWMRHGGGSSSGILRNCRLIGNLTMGSYGGGARGGVLYNCWLSDNMSYGGGGAYGATLYDCWIVSNRTTLSTARGGGVSESTLYNCTLMSNQCPGTYNGGAAYNSTLSNCTLINNWAINYGGGAYASTLYNCTLIGNQANDYSGGGSHGGTLYNCTIISNTASRYGGGSYGGTLYNCALIGNTAKSSTTGNGGGAYEGTLYNCTITGNEAKRYGGGVCGGTSVNSIVWDNLAPSAGETNRNYDPTAVFSNSCTYPDPGGVGNIAADPKYVAAGNGYGTNHVVGNYNLRGQSPCVNKGLFYSWMTDPADARSKDRDGRERVIYGIVDLGAYEFYVPSGTVLTFR